MRYIYLALIGLFALVTLLFMLQNLEPTTIVFFSARLTLPTSALVVLAYFLGMITGGSLAWLLRAWIHGATKGVKNPG